MTQQTMKRPVAINTQIGFENWSDQSFEFRAFIAKHPGQPPKEEALYIAGQDQSNFLCRSLRPPVAVLPLAGRDPAMGQWYTGVYELEEGTLLKLVTKQSAPRFGDRMKSLQAFIRVRQDAALVHIGMDLPAKVGRTISEAHMYGRMEIISLEQAMEEGAFVHPKFRHLYNDTFGDALTVRTIEPALSAPAVVKSKPVKDAAGQEATVRIARRGRHIRSALRSPD